MYSSTLAFGRYRLALLAHKQSLQAGILEAARIRDGASF